jgi:hypothetical protein
MPNDLDPANFKLKGPVTLIFFLFVALFTFPLFTVPHIGTSIFVGPWAECD